ncbi:MAG: prephenate dehydrogenase/arogenate dehydrogenase family protein [Acidobacteria bacterium]|nr:prephenate dehydrogenase/arogenate dehydrogenase family protein [Acidobacteriota bacterium]MBA3887138.1 prephenate dehydrogenase/arogenate dehydrogenase family protein [Acidobacteriota bacterium]
MPTRLPMADTRRESSAPPPFARVAIVGFGLIGASLGLAIKQRWPQALVIAVDRKDVIETAMRMHAADVGGDDLVLAAEAELIVLAAPVQANHRILRELADHVPGVALVTDVGSTKRETVAAAQALPERLRFIGGHPLAGAAVGGIEAARGDLFHGRPWILTPSSSRHETGLLGTMLEAIGAQVRTLAPEAHDALVTYLSHLPQLVASALMHVVGTHTGAEGLALAGRGLRDSTRLATSPPGVWRDIVATNHDNISAALDDLIEVLRRLQAGEGAADDLGRTFESAADWKRTLEQAFDDPAITSREGGA